MKLSRLSMAGLVVVALGGCAGTGGEPQDASFFVTSKGKGDGANYGGLAAAHAYSGSLAAAPRPNRPASEAPDRQCLKPARRMESWNSSHGSAGCSQPALVKTGGGALLYCLAPSGDRAREQTASARVPRATGEPDRRGRDDGPRAGGRLGALH